MENMLLVGLSRQMALTRQLDVIANNIANLNTTGFKSHSPIFEQFLGSGARQGSGRVSFVHDRGTWHDFGQGAIQRTDNPLDVAIDGEAFLVVQTPNGERYTRNGALQLDTTGQIVTTDGHPVLGTGGPIVLQRNDSDISISPDGRISVREGSNNKTDSLRGKLRLVSFASPQQLKKEGASYYLAPADVTAQPDNKSRVVQGAIEKSNVSGMMEMARMIEITRAYTHIGSMLQQQHDINRNSLQHLVEVPN
jgi:flagellar basal-body rod protein FlgF